MRFARLLVPLFIVLTLVSPVPGLAADDECRFRQGFRTLRDLIPEVVGDCLEDEHTELETGNQLQRTTRGLLVWRADDNWTAFTDGTTTWINGPRGIESRPNGALLSWERGAPLPESLAGWEAAAAEQGRPIWRLLGDAQAEFIAANGVPMEIPFVPDPQLWNEWAAASGVSTIDLLLYVFYGNSPTDGPTERAALTEVNRHRVANGLNPIALNQYAVLAARAQSIYNVVNLTRNQHEQQPGAVAYIGQWAVNRARYFGAEQAFIGENSHVIRGPARAVQGWMDSPPHRANTLQDERAGMAPVAMGYAESEMGDFVNAIMTIGPIR
jgi:hypothetical protein